MKNNTLIVGGACQGKLEYAKSEFGLEDSDIAIYNSDKAFYTNKNERVIYGFHMLVRKWLKEGLDPICETQKIDAEFVISDEIGNGIVPIDQFERQWRDEVGKCCCFLAKKAERVIRVYCGIGTVIK